MKKNYNIGDDFMKDNFNLFAVFVLGFISVSYLFADEAFEKVIQYYNSKQYENVITESEKVILNSDEQKSELRFLIGISWLYLNDFKQAITNLTAALELNKKNYLANFYLGIAYLKIKNYEKAINEFNLFIKYSQDKNLIETAKKHLERIIAEQDNINSK